MQNAPVVQGKVVGSAYDMGPQDATFGGPQPVMHDELNVLQMSCKNTALPPEIRLGFVKKVYGILGTMLLITFGLAQFFVFQKEATLESRSFSHHCRFAGCGSSVEANRMHERSF